VPSIDLQPWFHGDDRDRAEVAARVDEALRTAGFLLITGHEVSTELRDDTRAVAREFFALPEDVKRRYATTVGGRGWLPPGAEANGYAEGTPTPPDLKESFTAACDNPTGDPRVDAEWFAPNVWSAELPRMREVVGEYLDEMHALSDELMALCAVALGLDVDYFEPFLTEPTYGFNINWYPPLTRVGPPAEGQFRIGPHTDFGTVTVLDREPGLGGLQIYTQDGEWVDAPYDPAAFTVNIGDLMARWTGDRWRSGRHRVLPPPADAPAEELMSLVYFGECTPGTIVESVPAPVGRVAYEPVDSHVYLREKLDSITVG
jgi:isopenicillin N synthase-like dioxygenase